MHCVLPPNQCLYLNCLRMRVVQCASTSSRFDACLEFAVWDFCVLSRGSHLEEESRNVRTYFRIQVCLEFVAWDLLWVLRNGTA